jgi:hypothetical protein
MSALLDVLGASDGAAAGRAGDDDGGCGSTGSPMMTSGLSASLRSRCASLIILYDGAFLLRTLIIVVIVIVIVIVVL